MKPIGPLVTRRSWQFVTYLIFSLPSPATRSFNGLHSKATAYSKPENPKKSYKYFLPVINLVLAAATAHAVDTVDIKDGAVTNPKLAADALERPVDIVWLESGTKWKLPDRYYDLDGALGTGYCKVPFSAANSLDFGITSSMTFNDKQDSVTINRDGLYAFKFSSSTAVGESTNGDGHGGPVNVEVNIIRGGSRLRILDAKGGHLSASYESFAAGNVMFPAKVGDKVFVFAAYDTAVGDIVYPPKNMDKLGYLRNRSLSISLVHPGPVGTLKP